MTTIRNHLAYYWLAYAYALLFSANTLATSFVAAFTGKNWATLSRLDVAIIIGAMLANWTATMMAFLSKTMARLQAGRSPIDTGDTTQITKA